MSLCEIWLQKSTGSSVPFQNPVLTLRDLMFPRLPELQYLVYASYDSVSANDERRTGVDIPVIQLAFFLGKESGTSLGIPLLPRD